MPFGHIKKNQRNDKVARYVGPYSRLLQYGLYYALTGTYATRKVVVEFFESISNLSIC